MPATTDERKLHQLSLYQPELDESLVFSRVASAKLENSVGSVISVAEITEVAEVTVGSVTSVAEVTEPTEFSNFADDGE